MVRCDRYPFSSGHTIILTNRDESPICHTGKSMVIDFCDDKDGCHPEIYDYYTVTLFLIPYNWNIHKLPLGCTGKQFKNFTMLIRINKAFLEIKKMNDQFVNLFVGRKFIKNETLDP